MRWSFQLSWQSPGPRLIQERPWGYRMAPFPTEDDQWLRKIDSGEWRLQSGPLGQGRPRSSSGRKSRIAGEEGTRRYSEAGRCSKRSIAENREATEAHSQL